MTTERRFLHGQWVTVTICPPGTAEGSGAVGSRKSHRFVQAALERRRAANAAAAKKKAKKRRKRHPPNRLSLMTES